MFVHDYKYFCKPGDKSICTIKRMDFPQNKDGTPDLSTFTGRLRYAMVQANKTSQSALAREIGVKPQAIQYLAEPKNNASGSAHVAALASSLQVSAEWLANGKGAMRGIVGSEVNPTRPTAYDNVGPAPDVRGMLPLISWIQAGSWNDAEDPFQPGDAEEWLPCARAHSPRSYALRVHGDSMTAVHGNSKTYPENSIIFVDPERRSPINGERIIAKLTGSDKVTFKVFKQEDGRTWLQPLNPTHEPIRDEFTVLGTVIGKWEDE